MRPRIPLRLLAGAVGIGTAMEPCTATLGTAPVVETYCGLTATVTVRPGQPEVREIDGDDVIVAEDVSRVHALGGDDAICVTGPARIAAGAGNDRVPCQSKAGTKNVVILGSGSDLFEGRLRGLRRADLHRQRRRRRRPSRRRRA